MVKILYALKKLMTNYIYKVLLKHKLNIQIHHSLTLKLKGVQIVLKIKIVLLIKKLIYGYMIRILL